MSQLIALFLVIFLQSGRRLSATKEPHRIALQDEIERKKKPACAGLSCAELATVDGHIKCHGYPR
jgi:hypothetical protein